MKKVILLLLLLFVPYLMASENKYELAAGWFDRHPELLWLADESVEVTQEAIPHHAKDSWSKLYLGQSFQEVDRSCLALLNLHRIARGRPEDYQGFVAAQKEPVLSWDDFSSLHGRYQQLLHEYPTLTEAQILDVLETGILLLDLGKCRHFMDELASFGLMEGDQYYFHVELLELLQEHPELVPSYARLPSEGKQLLYDVRDVGHYGHMTHLEGGVEMFDAIVHYWRHGGSRRALEAHFLMHICDVSAALGHVHPYSSLVLRADVLANLEEVHATCLRFVDPSFSKEQGWLKIASDRAHRLHAPRIPDGALGRVYGRLLASMRIDGASIARIVCLSLSKLSEEKKTLVCEQFGCLDPKGYTPTYIPAVYVNYMQALVQQGVCLEEATAQCVRLVVPWLASAKAAFSAFDQDPLNFNSIAGSVRKNPLCVGDRFALGEHGHLFLP